MKRKPLILTASILLTLGCLFYVVRNGLNYKETMTGEIIDMYKFDNVSKYGTHKEMRMVVRYPKITKDERVSADVFYNIKIGDKITLDEDIGENPFSVAIMVFGVVLFVFSLIFAVEYHDPKDAYWQ